MQKYIIESFTVNTTGGVKVYNRDERSGNYIHTPPNGGPVEIKGREDFLCMPNSWISKVTRQAINGATLETFSINDRINLPNRPIGVVFNITNMIIEQGDFILKLNSTTNNTIRLHNAVKYVEPVRNTVNTSESTSEVKKKVGRPSNKDKFFSDLQVKIEASVEPLRLTATLKRRKENPEQFLVKFFKEWNINTNEKAKDTILVSNGDVQTSSGRRRSLGDIFMILKYYYPSITLQEVVQLLYIRLPQVITPGFRTCKCSQIRKRVWHYSSSQENSISNKTDSDEYGYTYDKYLEMLNS